MCFQRYQPLAEPSKREHIPIAFPASIQPQSAPRRILEIGPGRGDYLFYLGEQNPEHVVLAIEIKPQRVDKIAERMQRHGLKNVCIIEGEGHRICKQLFKQNFMFEAIHINFPDPWPKNTHRKNRLITEDFLQLCANLLELGGKFHFATDVDWYAAAVAKLMKNVPQMQPLIPEVITQNAELVFPTFFHEKWKQMGRKTYYQAYVKNSSPS